MPYTGAEKVKPKCPHCKADLTFIMTDLKTKLGGYHCPSCDAMGKTGVYKRGDMIVGRP